MRRLYLQIYLTIAGILLLFTVLASLTWWLLPRDDLRMMRGLGELAGDLLPDPERPQAEAQVALERLARQLTAQLTLRDADGAVVASVGAPLPAPDHDLPDGGRFRPRGHRALAALPLPDGRQLIWRPDHAAMPGRGLHFLGALAALALAIGLGAYPVVRGLTRRLERLRGRVDALGAGELTTRVEVEGRDEIAHLARSFNAAAEQIERLIGAQRTLLASASHELRTPLTRIRMAAELMEAAGRPELRDQMSRDIEELDELIGELLLASRLDAVTALDTRQEIDLLGLLAEETARYDLTASGAPTLVRGDRPLLRHLVRNLLENAHRHASGVEVSLEAADGGGTLLRVADRGPGVPEEECERIFEPFYRRASDDRGVGLGLALVRRIARLHGGEVRCRTRAGGGLSFEVTLPA